MKTNGLDPGIEKGYIKPDKMQIKSGIQLVRNQGWFLSFDKCAMLS